MGRKDNTNSTSQGLFIHRLVLTLKTIAIAAFTFLELGVALDLGFTNRVITLAMWLGSLMWAVMTIRAWARRTRVGLILPLIVTSFALVSVHGIFTSEINDQFLQWASVCMAILLLLENIGCLLKLWKPGPAKRESSE